MAKTPSQTADNSGIQDNANTDAYDPDSGLQAAPFRGNTGGLATGDNGVDINRVQSGSDETAREIAMNEEREIEERFRKENMGPLARIARLEGLALKYFGEHHFEPYIAPFNPEAERDSARARFQQEMERIEAAARNPS